MTGTQQLPEVAVYERDIATGRLKSSTLVLARSGLQKNVGSVPIVIPVAPPT